MNRSHIPWLVNPDGSPGYTWSPTSGCGPGLPCFDRCWARAYHVRYRKGDFSVKLHPDKLDAPLRLRKPSVIGVSLMGDLFHKKVDNNAAYGYPFIASVFGVMASRPDHTFILLTKRPERAREILAGPDRLARTTCVYHAADRVKHPGLMCPSDGPWPLPNVWLSVSVEDQATADARIPILLDTPAAHRWVSLEPQIGAVDLTRYVRETWRCKSCGAVKERGQWATRYGIMECGRCMQLEGGLVDQLVQQPHLDLVIQGCESGPRRRPFLLQWARDVRDQCRAAGVHYALKQRHGCTYDECHAWEPGNECGLGQPCDEHRDRTVIEDHVLDGKVEWDLPWSHQGEGAR